MSKTDTERLDWLERVITGTGTSSFLKSAFIVSQDEGVALDIKTEPVVVAGNIREAIDEAMKQQNQNSKCPA